MRICLHYGQKMKVSAEVSINTCIQMQVKCIQIHSLDIVFEMNVDAAFRYKNVSAFSVYRYKVSRCCPALGKS